MASVFLGSGGMNGYISLCSGDPCPTIFRSPVGVMEDIMDNQVICAIYRLPDAHKHVTRPPVGVIFPKKIVTVGDVKPDPALWHEDNGRKPWENNRQNPHGSISGRQLGDAAHRLVVNSLQVKKDRNGHGDQMYAQPPYYAAASHGPPHSYPNARYQDQEHQRMVPPRTNYPAQGHHRSSDSSTVRSHHDHGYGQQYASSASHRPDNRSHPQYDRNNRSAGNGNYHTQGYYPQSSHQSGPRYPPRPAAQPPIPAGAHLHHQAGYNGYESYQSPGAASYNQWGGAWTPQAGQNPPRGYSQPQQLGNQFSALNRGNNRRPPPQQGYGRR